MYQNKHFHRAVEIVHEITGVPMAAVLDDHDKEFIDPDIYLQESPMWITDQNYSPRLKGMDLYPARVGRYQGFPQGCVWFTFPTWVWSWRYDILPPTTDWQFRIHGLEGCRRYPRIHFAAQQGERSSHISAGKLGWVVDQILLKEFPVILEPDDPQFYEMIRVIVSLWTTKGEATLYASTQSMPRPYPLKDPSAIYHTAYCTSTTIRFSDARTTSKYWKSREAPERTLRSLSNKFSADLPEPIVNDIKNILSTKIVTGANSKDAQLKSDIKTTEYQAVIERYRLANPEFIQRFAEHPETGKTYKLIMSGKQFDTTDFQLKDFDSYLKQELKEFEKAQRQNAEAEDGRGPPPLPSGVSLDEATNLASSSRERTMPDLSGAVTHDSLRNLAKMLGVKDFDPSKPITADEPTADNSGEELPKN